MNQVLIAVFSLFILSCEDKTTSGEVTKNSKALDSANYTTIQWIDTIKSIGTLQMGEKVQVSFRFKNTGDKPLYIISAQPGCGCTVVDYPKEAIDQGKEGEIIAAFDSNKGSVGSFKKGITVTTNTKPNGNTILFFQGEIKPKKTNSDKPAAFNEATTSTDAKGIS